MRTTQACTFWTNPASLSQFRTAAAIRFACHWTTNVMHWAGALSFGGASRGFVSLLEKWLYHGIIAPCGSFQTCPVAKPWMILIVTHYDHHIISRHPDFKTLRWPFEVNNSQYLPDKLTNNCKCMETILSSIFENLGNWYIIFPLK